jgi:hypothetical protein
LHFPVQQLLDLGQTVLQDGAQRGVSQLHAGNLLGC